MDNHKRRPTTNKYEQHRKNNARCFRFASKISLGFLAAVPSLNLFLMKTNLEENSQVTVKHHDKRYQEARDCYQENVSTIFSEGHLTHGVHRGLSVFVPAHHWQYTEDKGHRP